MRPHQSIQTVLFDLDGTLIDTAQDLVSALSSLVDKPIALTPEMRAAAGRGCRGLIKAGLNIEIHDERYPNLAKQLLDHYEKHLLDTTKLFPGMDIILKHLDENTIPWGIVTNKPHKYTQLILEGLALSNRTHCVISGDSLTNRKPHPEPILHACELLKKFPQHCLYIGDTEIDVIASKAAGTHSVVALYGYIHQHENPKSWNADGYIQQPSEILQYL